MYRPDEMALILEQARQYTNSQRLGYKETKTVTILPETTLEIIEYEGMKIAVAIPENKVKSGDVLRVVWDGATYECAEHETGNAYGNMALIGEGEDSGEPFFISASTSTDSGDLIIFPADGASHNVSIKKEETRVKRIDAEYLPLTLPIVPISLRVNLDMSAEVGYGSTLANPVAGKLDEFHNQKIPAFVCEIYLDGFSHKTAGLFLYNDYGYYGYVSGFQGTGIFRNTISILLTNLHDGQWRCMTKTVI